MLQAVILLLGAALPANPNWIGTVNATMRPAELHRSGHAYRALPGAGILPGDVLLTAEGGGATLLLHNAQLVYIGPASRVATDADGQSIRLLQGEARVTVGGQALSLRVGSSKVTTDRGILRAATSNRGTRIWVENGAAYTMGAQGEQRLSAGEEIWLSPNGTASPVAQSSGADWSIRVVDYQMAALAPEVSTADGLEPDDCVQQPEEPAKEQPEEERSEDEEDREEEPTATDDDAERGAADDAGATDLAESNSSFSPSPGGLALSGSSASSLGLSGGLFSDAQQDTRQGRLRQPYFDPPNQLNAGDPFPGNIHLVTGETRYNFSQVQLNQAERNAVLPGGNPAYFSVGLGDAPQGQVTTTFLTGSNPVPDTIQIPRFDAYLIRLDQYAAVDSTLDPEGARQSNVGFAGLLGRDPVAPAVIGATPLEDDRARINERATFALGEFRLRTDSDDNLELAIRRSDQDRIIEKHPGGDDSQDRVTVNPDVTDFDDVVDPRFLPANPTVKVPTDGAYKNESTRYSNLNLLRRAATTTLMADQLQEFSRRTGQTRFVLTEPDGRNRIIDISGYKGRP